MEYSQEVWIDKKPEEKFFGKKKSV